MGEETWVEGGKMWLNQMILKNDKLIIYICIQLKINTSILMMSFSWATTTSLRDRPQPLLSDPKQMWYILAMMSSWICDVLTLLINICIRNNIIIIMKDIKIIHCETSILFSRNWSDIIYACALLQKIEQKCGRIILYSCFCYI